MQSAKEIRKAMEIPNVEEAESCALELLADVEFAYDAALDLNDSGHTDATALTSMSEEQHDGIDRMIVDENAAHSFVDKPPFGSPFHAPTNRNRNNSRVWSAVISSLRNSSIGSLSASSVRSPSISLMDVPNIQSTSCSCNSGSGSSFLNSGHESWFKKSHCSTSLKAPPPVPKPKPFYQRRRSSSSRGGRSKRKIALPSGNDVDVDEADPVREISLEGLHATLPTATTHNKGKIYPKQSPLAKKLNRSRLNTKKLESYPFKKGKPEVEKETASRRAGSSEITTPGRKKRKRTRRKEPAQKKYVDITDLDVLLGRGGLSNHHPGNQAYRKHILEHQKQYKLLKNSAKTQMSIDVVAWVKARGGRFLKRDEEIEGRPFYIATEATARQKVSQALREDHSPEGRKLKKSRAKATKM